MAPILEQRKTGLTSADSPIRSVADTARWVATYRAIESERPDAVFRDPFARRLAGARGEEISRSMPGAQRAAWAFVARTWLFDEYIRQQVASGVTLVVNLAAGFDTRPYRMQLPPALRWVEVDQPELLAEKDSLLTGVTPTCSLERIPLDLAVQSERQALFRRLGQSAQRVLIVTEGLLVYLAEEEVGRFASDLAAEPSFGAWVLDLASPALLKMIQKDWGRRLQAAGAQLRFAPETGPAFLERFGWRASTIRPTLTTAAALKRLPLLLRLVARFPGAGNFHPRRPWSAACLCVPTGSGAPPGS